MGFFNICPRDKKYLDYNCGDIPLKVIQDDGIEITPDFKVNITDLNKGHKHFQAVNGRGDKFKISVIIHKDDEISLTGQTIVNTPQVKTTWSETSESTADLSGTQYAKAIDIAYDIAGSFKVSFLLDYFMRNLIPLYIHSDIIDIDPSWLYVITENKHRKQEYLEYTVWDLTFTRYAVVEFSKFTKTSKGVEQALKDYKKKKASAKLTDKQKLAKCDWKKTLIFRSKKKVLPCVKLLQKILKKNGCYKPKKISGWYNVNTRNGIKAYQTKHKKDYGLKVTGKMNQQTFNCLIGRPNQVGKTKKTTKTSIQKNLPKATSKTGVVNVNVTNYDAKYMRVKVAKETLIKPTVKKTTTTTNKSGKNTGGKSTGKTGKSTKNNNTSKKTTTTVKKGKSTTKKNTTTKKKK